ncbi:MAG: very short patch repair endonuclease [Spirochaetes bacterium]|nr:very short patch repair endonuclease [Spirochaetota bacterium]
MSKVSGKDTKPEILVRKYLFSMGFRYRKNVNYLPGKPDIVLPKYKTIIFIHGCFWHGHKNCEAAKLPVSNADYWTMKVTSNIERDSKNKKLLKKLGWNVIIIWECELKTKNRNKRLGMLVNQLHITLIT